SNGPGSLLLSDFAPTNANASRSIVSGSAESFDRGGADAANLSSTLQHSLEGEHLWRTVHPGRNRLDPDRRLSLPICDCGRLVATSAGPVQPRASRRPAWL